MSWAETQIEKSLHSISPQNSLSKVLSEEDMVEVLRNHPERIKKLDALDRAKLIACYPAMEQVLPYEDLPETYQAVLAKRFPLRFLERLSLKSLNIQSYRYLMFANAHLRGYCPPPEEKSTMRILFKNMNDEVAKSIRYKEWIYLLKCIPSAAKKLKISSIRNQTELRRLIVEQPIVMKYSSLEEMQKSPIAGATWARLIADIPARQRSHFPVGSKDWIEKQIFVRHLKVGKTKAFKEWTANLP